MDAPARRPPSVNPHPVGYVGGRLDRSDHLRTDDRAVARLAEDPAARWLLFDGARLLTTAGASGRIEPLWLARDELPDAEDGLQIFLGLDNEAPGAGPRGARFAIGGSQSGLPGELLDLRPGASALSAEDTAIVGQAASLLAWHRRHRFCANCGAATLPAKAGYQRCCPACSAEHFPRVDPVVIMLATCGDLVLVGRGRNFPDGFYSALAGFIEPGESLEEAVARELFEESGVVATSVRYVASQPWPFPSNLMLGAFAEAHDTALRLDETEIADALWLTRGEVAAGLRGESPVQFPPPIAIAHLLLWLWAKGEEPRG